MTKTTKKTGPKKSSKESNKKEEKKTSKKTTKKALKKGAKKKDVDKKTTDKAESISPKKAKIIKTNFYWGAGVTIFSLILLFVFIASMISGFISMALKYEVLVKDRQEEEYKTMKLEEFDKSYVNGLEFLESSEYALDEDAILESEEFFIVSNNDSRRISALNFVYSPDGENFAYVITEDEENGSSVVLNGKKGPVYEAIKFMLFSPDSKHFAYGVREGDDEFVVLDGVEGRAYDWILSPYQFTPDSRFLVYKARDKRGDFLVFNQSESGPYDQIYNPFINKDKNEFIFYSRIENKIIKHNLKLQEYAN